MSRYRPARRARRNSPLAPQLDAAYDALRRLPSSPKVAPLLYALEAELPDVPGSRFAARGASGSRPEAYLRGLLQAAQTTLAPPPVEPVVRLPATHRPWDASLVATLKADIKRLVALYRSLYPPSSWKDGRLIEPEAQVVRKWVNARDAFRDAVNNWEYVVYHVLLADKPDENRNYEERPLAAKAWSFLHEIRPSGLFPTRWDYETERHDMLAPWELVKNRDKSIRRIQTRGREFAKALDEFFIGGGPVERRPAFDVYNIDGVKVVIDNRYREEAKKDPLYSFEDYLRELHRQMQPIRKAGFGHLLQDLVIVIDFDPKASAAGTYSHYGDKVTILPWGMNPAKSHVLTHELGHRLYYKHLKPQAVKAWDERMKSRKTYTTEADVDLLATLLPPDRADQYHYEFKVEPVHRAIEALPVDDLQKIRLAYLAQEASGRFAESKAAALRKLRDFSLDHPLLLEHFSDYGATKPEEAFAEAFDRYVRLGPRALGPWTRAFFEDVVRPARQARDNPRRPRTPRLPR